MGQSILVLLTILPSVGYLGSHYLRALYTPFLEPDADYYLLIILSTSSLAKEDGKVQVISSQTTMLSNEQDGNK